VPPRAIGSARIWHDRLYDGLAEGLVFGRQSSEAWPKGARGALAVHADANALSAHLVSFDLAHIVRDVVDLVQVPIGQPPRQCLFEAAADVVRQPTLPRPGWSRGVSLGGWG